MYVKLNGSKTKYPCFGQALLATKPQRYAATGRITGPQ